MGLSEPRSGARFWSVQAADESAEDAADDHAESRTGDARPRFTGGLGDENDGDDGSANQEA